MIIRTIAFSSALALSPISPAPVVRVHVAPGMPVYEWPEHREPVDRDKDHPAEEQGTLVFGVGASGIHTNVAAQHIWYQSDYTSIAWTHDLDLEFLKTPRTNLSIRIEPRTKQVFRDGITLRSTGSRSGR